MLKHVSYQRAIQKNFQPVVPTPPHFTLPSLDFKHDCQRRLPIKDKKRWRLRRSLFVSFDVEDDKLTAVIKYCLAEKNKVSSKEILIFKRKGIANFGIAV